ncbi:hypothetical protein K466DRAFT_665532 [Polyporus arcularius HHB13444]|uniref:F-box domain-containing protein n=1 Tax=Polyporus arcularius HHB13444 TaxID=1314778 RepID=A0A5C3P4U4_9APHY|nr:hypothetical protein K466DRAFT_665532 [Polyporus arcularius HHB13444]
MLNQDILQVIFEALAAPDNSWYEYEGVAIPGRACWSQERDEVIRRATLAACVRVCRAFFEPAACVLWKDLDDLGVLPACDEGVSGDVARPCSSLKRRQQYLSHIRAIHHPQRPSGVVPHVIASRAEVEKASPLALTKLRWIQEVPGRLDLLTLLSPSLQSLHVIFRHPHSWRRDQASGHRDFVETLLVGIAERAPTLTYLRITRTSGIPESWLVPIRRFSRAETIDLREPMYDAVSSSALLQPLSTLQHLRTLRLRFQSTSCAPALGVETGFGGFGALRELHLNGKFAQLQDATGFLRRVASPHLRSLRIDDCECRTDTFAEALHDFCAVLESQFAFTLQVVALSVYGIGPSLTLERPLAECLHPLLQVGGLRDVRLSLAPKGVLVAVSEADMRAMADSWPLLERLHLSCGLCESGGGPGLSHGVVEWMRQACARLEDIQLPIDEERVAESIGGRIDACAGPDPRK